MHGLSSVELSNHPEWHPYGFLPEVFDRRYVVMTEGKFAGQVMVNFQGGKTFVSYAILPEFRGKGLAKAAVKVVLDHLGVPAEKAWAYIVKGNEASVHLADSLGINIMFHAMTPKQASWSASDFLKSIFFSKTAC
jgi:RimJ/RimL family protein N-acetyltransferase